MATFQVIVATLAVFTALLTLLVLFPLRRPTTPVWWAVKALPTVLSPFLFIAGLLFIAAGIFFHSSFIAVFGFYSALIFGIHILKVTQEPDYHSGFEQAFGHDWEKSIPTKSTKYFLQSRFGFNLPEVPDPKFTQNIPFYTIPGTNRKLLCDVWEPADNIPRSGLAFIYLHGSAWCVLDKDVGTRPFFRHLTAQGHVVMDVAYRLYPETDMMGMVHDARHAIAWMKDHALDFEVHPDRIVIGGGSAGGHIALLAAYTEHNRRFMPDDLLGSDTSVRAVISIYGPTDLETLYYHTGQYITSRTKPGQAKKEPSAGIPVWVQKRMGNHYHRLGFDKNMEDAFLAAMFGGHPDELPQPYEQFSPVAHIHQGCPPTFIIQGEHDIITSPKATRFFCSRLQDEGIPVVMHVLPQIDHGFDLFLPALTPSAHNAYYDIERFLALMCNDEAFYVKKKEVEIAAEV